MLLHRSSAAIVAATSLIISASAIAAEDEIIVTATRQPERLVDALPNAQVITAADIERLQPRDLPRLLGRLSGVDFRDSGGRGSVSGVFIRGAAPSQSIVLIDGIRSASATVGATALENIPVEAIERIEVVKGPLSGLYGADAIGGVIQIFTKRGQAGPPTPTLYTRYRTDDTHEYTASVSGGSERGGYHGSFSYEDSSGLDRTTIDTGGNHDRDGFDEFAFNFSAHYRPTDTLEGRFSMLRTDAHSEFDNTFGPDMNHDLDSKVENYSGKLLYTPAAQWRLTLDAGHFVDATVTPVFFSDITTKRTSVLMQADYQLHADHTVSGGFEYYDDKVETLALFSRTSRDNAAGFFQWQGRYGRFGILGNVRYDDNEVYGDNTNGSVALEYRLQPNLRFVASYGTAFRAPSFNDLFFPGFGNPNVRPEDSESVEISLRGSHFGANWRISAYDTDVEDLIGFDLATFTANNTADASLRGIEFEFARTVAGWNLQANMNFLDADDDTTGLKLADRAAFAANASVFRSFGKVGVSIDLQAEDGRRESGNLELQGFVIAGVGASYDVCPQLRLSARVDNLWDENYTQNLVSPVDAFRTYGRTATISLRASY